jgi:DMSO/TMAO reductase YedYZ molybdopterin-dependent catalytic subunit
MKTITILIVILGLLSACSAQSPQPNQTPLQPTPTMEKSATSAPSPTYLLSSPCNLSPITVPVMPAVIPGYTQLDEATRLHMTGKPIVVDLNSYHLKVSGLVDKPAEWNYEELRCMTKVTVKASLVCPGFFVDTTTWSGVPFATLLEQAGVKKTASQIVMVSADGYETHIPITDALNEHNFLAYEWMGQPLPVLHGFPVRAVFPQLDGASWAKWLIEIKVE